MFLLNQAYDTSFSAAAQRVANTFVSARRTSERWNALYKCYLLLLFDFWCPVNGEGHVKAIHTQFIKSILTVSVFMLHITFVWKMALSRGGERRTQKLKSHLVRTQSLNVLPLKPGVGEYIAIHATLTARDFFLLISTLPVHSPAFVPKPLPIFSCVGPG